jgi:hypothetical protein
MSWTGWGVKPLAFGQNGELGPGFEYSSWTSWHRGVRTKRPSGTSCTRPTNRPTAQYGWTGRQSGSGFSNIARVYWEFLRLRTNSLAMPLRQIEIF